MQKIYPADFLKIPNMVSMIRLLLFPVLIYLAHQQKPLAFILVVIFVEFTDLLDGFLARLLNQTSELGAMLDSIGDFFVYTSYVIGAWLLWPDIVIEHRVVVIVISLSIVAPVLVGLIKYRELTSYHTWSTKAAVASTVVAYLLLFTGITSWPIYVAGVLCVIASAEEVCISLVLDRPKVNIKSLLILKPRQDRK